MRMACIRFVASAIACACMAPIYGRHLTSSAIEHARELINPKEEL